MNNFNSIKQEELITINGGGITGKQVLGVATGIAAGFAFGPWACAGIAVGMLVSDAIDDDDH